MCNITALPICRILEYNEFFVGDKPIDIREVLCMFNRNDLVRMAALLSLHYGNIFYPNEEQTMFSCESRKHKPYLDSLFFYFYEKNGLQHDEKVIVSTYRTALELWRHIFAIRPEKFTNTAKNEDKELLLFKVLLSLNEKIVSFTHSDKQYELDELIFLNQFITNDSNNYDFKSVMQPQIYYFNCFVETTKTNQILKKATECLFAKWGITSWCQYIGTILWFAKEADQYHTEHKSGTPLISSEKMRQDGNNSFFSRSLIDNLCIEEDEYIPLENCNSQELNTDFRQFRAKPFVRLKDGSGYLIINNQLLCERLFNSLYFDYKPFIDGRKGCCGRFDFNKEFIDKILFRQTFFLCLPTSAFLFPPSKDYEEPEEKNEPDFYVRYRNGDLLLVECKAIKMNGECRDDGDYSRLLTELHEKIVVKTRNLDKSRKHYTGTPEPIGIGQLISHIDKIEDDDFQWDRHIPNEVAYYPLLVFEDVKILSCGLLSMLNRWFYEEIHKKPKMSLTEMSIMPVIAVSIDTLFLYDDLIRKRGLTHIIDEFISKYAQFNVATGEYYIDSYADFDSYLRNNKFDKRREVDKIVKNIFAC